MYAPLPRPGPALCPPPSHDRGARRLAVVIYPCGSGWQVRECWDGGLTVAETVLVLNIQGLNRQKLNSWIASRAEIIIWRHRWLCQDMRPGLDWTKNHNQ